MLPEQIYVLPLRERPLAATPLFESDESPRDLPLFIQHDNKLISFAPLQFFSDFAERRGYLDLLESKPTKEFIKDEDQRRLFVWLLGKHWGFFLNRWKGQGLYVEHKKKRAFFQLVKGDKNRIIYDTQARRGVRRDVVKQRPHGKYIEYENEGIYYSVVEFSSYWALQIKPFYMFTRSDGCTPIPSFLMGRRATRRIKFDRNKNVGDDLIFWTRYLSGGQTTLSLGDVGVDDLILDTEYCSAEVPVLNREVNFDENAD